MDLDKVFGFIAERMRDLVPAFSDFSDGSLVVALFFTIFIFIVAFFSANAFFDWVSKKHLEKVEAKRLKNNGVI